MRFALITLFPEAVEAAAGMGVTGTALRKGAATLTLHNPREACTDVHRTVDDRPFGGGPGMVMKAEPLATTVRQLKGELPDARVVLMSPQGRQFDQALAQDVADDGRPLVLVAGRYEGVDERLMSGTIDEEWSIGDFVLSGGELPALMVVDAVVRLLPRVLGHPDSARQDSFSDGLLDHPHYTRPEEFEGQRVPPVLLSGDHARIARWRKQQALGRTLERRPELLERRELNDEDNALLEAYLNDRNGADKT